MYSRIIHLHPIPPARQNYLFEQPSPRHGEAVAGYAVQQPLPESLYEESLPDFVKLMDAYGHVGIRVTKREELRAKWKSASP